MRRGVRDTSSHDGHSRAPRSGEPGIQKLLRTKHKGLDSGFALTRAPE
jgi:hypothetical protein